MRGCWSWAQHQRAPRSRGKAPSVECSQPPEPGNTTKHRFELYKKDNTTSIQWGRVWVGVFFFAYYSFTASRDTTWHKTLTPSNHSAAGFWFNICVCVCVFLHLSLFIISDLDKGEGRSGTERLRFVLDLILDVLFHSLLLVDLLLLLHVEEDSWRHGDGDGILWLGLRG